ncbi:MAG: hypothetical protein GY727_10455 [Gammaproteobacteria bacterium]|nr:hypothetical protein [Gammaproteobacteria bacterium]MCP4091128.1 hypothetical protein [Gammaproteobacteria bacterium]MCP4277346.1 hypothetical protein [Gammaproteobacteria bacterium]MCP4831593.1 hypothetical protein [Gammaproteobacteria bacterium]MCP4927816.1 hypothetical protein [Gammaproteobacteria bacterium]
MNFFATWLAAQRIRRVVLIAALFPLPVLGMISAAIVVMVAQVRGLRETLLDCVLALVLLAGIAWFANMEAPVLLGSAAISWLLWVVLGTIVVRTGSLALAVQSAVIIALAGLVVFNLVIGDPVAYWGQVLEVLYADLAQQGFEITADIEQQAQLMSGIVIAGSLTGGMIALLLGSAWASHLSNGNYAQQFVELRLGYVIGGLAALAGIAGLFGFGLDGTLLIFGAAFVFHGIAVVAWWSRYRNWPGGWWIGLCILPILLPDFSIFILALLSMLGFVDNWYGLRRAPAMKG